jgi:voltage-gated potassium channel
MVRAVSRPRLIFGILSRRLKRVGPIFLGGVALASTLLYFLERDEPGTKINALSDAVWLCVVTMSTVGYGDVTPVTSGGRIVTGVFILFTLVTLGLLLGAFTEAVVEVKRMEEHGLIGTRMTGHVIVCGWNAMSRSTVAELLAADRKVAVLCELTEDVTAVREAAGGKEIFVTHGEPRQEIFRERLNALSAQAVVIAMADDAKNLIAALNLRAINPQLRVVVALQREELRQTLMAGGVTYVASPNELSGRLVASAAFEPEVALFVEDLMSGAVGEFDMQQYQAGDKLGGRTVAEVRDRLAEIDGPLLVALARRDGAGIFKLMPHPPREARVETSDQIIVLASDAQAGRLAERYGVRQGR